MQFGRHLWKVALALGPYPLLLLGLQSAKAPKKVSLESDLMPIFKAHCVSCHGADSPAGGLNLTSAAGLMKGGTSGAEFIPGKPDLSILLQRVLGTGGKPRMPMGFAPLSDQQLATIRVWIQQGAKTKDDSVSFSTDILPVLKARCGDCHSGKSPAAGLDLTSAQGLTKGGTSGKLLTPGDPNASLIMTRLKGLGGKPQMPMGFVALSSDKLQLFQKWISEGADMTEDHAKHWAYVKPEWPQLPSVKEKAWAKNPIDMFVLARLEAEGLKPSPEASKEELIRRVTLDLIGLPPTLKEIDDFLKDESPNAYAKVVDRLLNSPHYGERQARPWLDLARYADSDGYEKDLKRSAWKYRDWVIDAFNKNMPYDEFTVEQLAGDMLPNPTVDQIVATGFHRNTMFNREGGVDQEEAHFNVILDRVGTTATVWLGSTLACARCHDHKYDPFTQKDFYKLYAFFDNTVVLPRGDASISEQKWFEPTIQVPSPQQAQQERTLRAEIGAVRTKLNTHTPEMEAAFEQWKAEAVKPLQWSVLTASSLKAAGGATFARGDDGSYLVTGPNPPKDDFNIEIPATGKPLTGLRFELLPDKSLGGNGPGREPNGNFVLTKVELSSGGNPLPIREAQASYVQDGYDPMRLIAGDENSGWAVYPKPGIKHTLVLELAPTELKFPLAIHLEFHSPWSQHTFGKFRISATGAKSPFLELMPPELKKAAESKRDDRALYDYFVKIAPATAPYRERLAKAEKALEQLERTIPTALVMREKPHSGPLQSWLRHRGEFLNKEELVPADTPTSLPPMAKSLPHNRLGLARWLVSPENPLTARVEVNRLWEEYFGRGIVETSEDFGTQGSKPTHPELLDWLACKFVSTGWNMKAINRLIVTSAAYRQTSRASKGLLERDPLNELLARGPRFRMEAEMIRDNALMVSGLLNLEIGGPSVYPEQPEGIWDSPYSGENWMTSKGKEMYRRGLYTFWKRTAPYPSFMAFDATSRETCTVRRIRTNTPLQALALLNDESMIDAARALADRLQREADKTDAGKIVYGFRLCTSRRPSPPEKQRLLQLISKLRKKYAADPALAKKLAGSPDRAAWTMLANVLLNLDETITKD